MPTLYVMKVNCNGVLRRISSRCSPPSFRHVNLRIRALLDIPTSKPISLTYRDTDASHPLTTAGFRPSPAAVCPCTTAVAASAAAASLSLPQASNNNPPFLLFLH
ncbi:unnamed protein product [Closterium sp. NIES-64]|nr:unnamed protein product [Closterium sp. NIES-64]